MFTEQVSLGKLSSGTASPYRPSEYGMEWGAYGLAGAGHSPGSTEVQHNSSLFDLRTAPPADTQSGSYPDTSCPDISYLDVGVMFDVCLPNEQIPHQKIGGDFADVIPLHGDWVALFLGDACGQGAAAALAVPQALYSLRQLLSESTGDFPGHSLGPHKDPAHTLKRLNRHLCSPAPPAACASVSLSLAILNTKTGEAMCAAAGSEPPLILRARGQIETISASRVPLGVEAGRIYHSVDFMLGSGDALLLATDGVTKAQKTNGSGSKTSLRYEGLTGLALKAFGLGGSPGHMARAVLSGARAFAGGSFHDHAAVLVSSRR